MASGGGVSTIGSAELAGSPARTVVIADAHRVMAEALRVGLGFCGFADVVVAADETVDALAGMVASRRPDAVLLDAAIHDARATCSLVHRLSAIGTSVLVLAVSREPGLLASLLEAGADGVFDKAQPFDTLVELLADALLGRTRLEPAARFELLGLLRRERADRRASLAMFSDLSGREREVLTRLAAGHTAEEIASEEVVSITTVRSHIRGILRKLGVNSQLAAVALAYRSGWVDVDSHAAGDQPLAGHRVIDLSESRDALRHA